MPAAARDQTVPAEGTRDRVLAVALELFRAQGYEKTSLREIAERLGITKAALYYHFKAKEDLLATLGGPFVRGFEALAERLASIPERERDPRSVLEAHLDFLVEQAGVASWIVDDFSALSHPDVGERIEATMDRMIGIVAGRRASVADRARAAAAIGAIVWALKNVPESIAVRDVLLDSALAALRGGATGSRRPRG